MNVQKLASKINKYHTSFIPLTENSNGEVNKRRTHPSPQLIFSPTAQEEGRRKKKRPKIDCKSVLIGYCKISITVK